MNRFPLPASWRTRAPVFLLACSILFVSCGGDDGGSSAPSTPIPVSGAVIKGPVSTSSVTIHAVATDGSPGSLIAGPFPTDALGNWSGEIPASVRGPFYLRATGGQYIDESSGASVDLGSGSMLAFTTSGSGTISPYSQLLVDVVAAAPASSEASQTWQDAVAIFQPLFGFDPTQTMPSSGGTTDQRRYAAALGGLTRLVDESTALSAIGSVTPFELAMAMIADLADGRLDGTDPNGAPIPIGSSGSTLPPLEIGGLGSLISAINDYADSVPALADLLFDPIDLDFGEIFDPPIGGGDGSLALSGPGAQALSTTTFEVAFANNSGGVFSWSAFAPNSGAMAISLIETSISNQPFVTIAFAFSETETSLTWQDSGTGSVPGLSHVGDIFSFEGVVLQSQDGVGNLVLDGQLTAGAPVGR